ncbi:MAG: MBL fold metallo-hydrolase [Acidobacteria bacterium]|nr:MBL fold metallo-hydrolase [Acidobacteriota bacterium]
MVELVMLGSGSRGNCALVRTERSALLVDAGLSARQIARRLDAVGQDPRRIDAILVTHEHRDHLCGVATFARKFHTLVLGNEATLAAAGPVVEGLPVERFVNGESLQVGAFVVTPFPVPHDAADPVGLVLEAEGVRIGYATDLGHVTHLVAARLAGCAALVIETNHDRDMLMDGPYPWVVKQRVASRIGHLSNDHAAASLPALAAGGTSHVVLAHISETNNDPGLARVTVETALSAAGLAGVDVHVARQDRPIDGVPL